MPRNTEATLNRRDVVNVHQARVKSQSIRACNIRQPLTRERARHVILCREVSQDTSDVLFECPALYNLQIKHLG